MSFLLIPDDYPVCMPALLSSLLSIHLLHLLPPLEQLALSWPAKSTPVAQDQLRQSTPCKGHKSTTRGAGTLFPALFAFELCCTRCATSLSFRFPYKMEILIYNLLWSNLSLQLERDTISFSSLSLLILGLVLLTLFILRLLVELEGIKEVWQHAAL